MRAVLARHGFTYIVCNQVKLKAEVIACRGNIDLSQNGKYISKKTYDQSRLYIYHDHMDLGKGQKSHTLKSAGEAKELFLS